MLIEEKISPKRVHHYSDAGMMIRQIETDRLYEDAVDRIPCRWTYEETDIPIETEKFEGIEAEKKYFGEFARHQEVAI